MTNDKKKRAGMFDHEQMIDAEVAAKMLATVGRQRAYNDRHARRIAADMKDGRFSPIDPIFFYDDDGSLADGQHRLRAVIISGTAWPFRTSEITRADAMFLDVGKLTRSPGAARRIRTGECIHNSVIAAIKIESRGFTVHDVRSTAAIVEILDAVPSEQIDVLTSLNRSGSVCRIPAGVLGVTMRAMRRGDTNVMSWFAGVRDNEPQDASSKELHDYLQRRRGKLSGGQALVESALVAAKAWKRRGGASSAIRTRSGDSVDDILPLVKQSPR
jgi:hypothetical protein